MEDSRGGEIRVPVHEGKIQRVLLVVVDPSRRERTLHMTCEIQQAVDELVLFDDGYFVGTDVAEKPLAQFGHFDIAVSRLEGHILRGVVACTLFVLEKHGPAVLLSDTGILWKYVDIPAYSAMSSVQSAEWRYACSEQDLSSNEGWANANPRRGVGNKRIHSIMSSCVVSLECGVCLILGNLRLISGIRLPFFPEKDQNIYLRGK